MSKVAAKNEYPMTNMLSSLLDKLAAHTPASFKEQTTQLVTAIRANLLNRVQQLDDRINDAHLLTEASRRTGLPPTALFFLAVTGMIVSFGIAVRKAGGLVSNAVGVLFPIYSSLRTLENKDPEEITRWISYWVLYGLITVLDAIRLSQGFSLKYRTLWNVAKIVGLYWLQCSGYSTVVYRGAIRPLLISNKLLPAPTPPVRTSSSPQTVIITSDTAGSPFVPYNTDGKDIS
ncbi:hypothetical protein SeMB42_g07253 [Synchytrium endobioticum]|uniref:Protein YOP1 n=1 Tax=Synchytrium endobioticum TaxID=286115 RepID=A0A507D936_9FUNG|nr:hypothetical protein SeMB42_g07253 [Synchytrium endobioticum]TPX47865.1 hypothetical protein SeLEV6574_g02425 [Synchytrium endobioticum]